MTSKHVAEQSSLGLLLPGVLLEKTLKERANQLPCSRLSELFAASPGVAMSGGAANNALGSLAAAYGDTTDDEDSDIEVIDIDSDSSEVEEVLPRTTTLTLKRPSMKQLAHSRKRQAGVSRLRVPGQGRGEVNPFTSMMSPHTPGPEEVLQSHSSICAGCSDLVPGLQTAVLPAQLTGAERRSVMKATRKYHNTRLKLIIVRECFDPQGNWLMHRRSRTCFKLDVM